MRRPVPRAPYAARICNSWGLWPREGNWSVTAARRRRRTSLETIDKLNGQIRDFDRQIEGLSDKKSPQTGALRQVKGVGPLTALAYVLILEDPHRFRRSRTVAASLGLRPRRHESGDRAPELGITKAGDPLLRRLLVTSAHYLLGPFSPDSALKRWGLQGPRGVRSPARSASGSTLFRRGKGS